MTFEDAFSAAVPTVILFEDVDAATLAREEPSAGRFRAARVEGSAWQAYLRKMLPAQASLKSSF